MRFALMTEPQQGLSYEEILALARAAGYPVSVAWRALRPARGSPGGHSRPLDRAGRLELPGNALASARRSVPPKADIRRPTAHPPDSGRRWGTAALPAGGDLRRRV